MSTIEAANFTNFTSPQCACHSAVFFPAPSVSAAVESMLIEQQQKQQQTEHGEIRLSHNIAFEFNELQRCSSVD